MERFAADGGVEDAKKALESAPAVLPAWRDIALGSVLLENSIRGPQPRKFLFIYFFGNETDKSSDGTITLQSQLEHRMSVFLMMKKYARLSAEFWTAWTAVGDPGNRDRF